ANASAAYTSSTARVAASHRRIRLQGDAIRRLLGAEREITTDGTMPSATLSPRQGLRVSPTAVPFDGRTLYEIGFAALYHPRRSLAEPNPSAVYSASGPQQSPVLRSGLCHSQPYPAGPADPRRTGPVSRDAHVAWGNGGVLLLHPQWLSDHVSAA